MPPDDASQVNDDSNGENNGEGQTQTLRISGIDFVADVPYREGHVLTKAEAQVLNQTYGENLGNNFRGRIKKAQTDAVAALVKDWEVAGSQGAKPETAELTPAAIDALRNEFAAYEADYEFNGKRVARPKGSAEDREANKLAKAKILEALKKKDIDPKTITDEKWVELIAQVLERNPAIREEAKRRVEAAKAIAQETMDLPELAV